MARQFVMDRVPPLTRQGRPHPPFFVSFHDRSIRLALPLI